MLSFKYTLILSICFIKITSVDKELKQVIAFFRHGARGPDSFDY